MSDTMRLSVRNAAIQEMLSSEDGIKNFYRFVAQNPHLDLHDACQIVVNRPNASVCFHFGEWNAMDRRVTKGRKGIPYVDRDGNRKFIFDANDTHGEERYKRLIYPMKRLLIGLDKVNATEYASENLTDYRKIQVGVFQYLKDNDYFTDDEERNKLIYEGVSYSLYCRTGFPKNNGITLHGLPYNLTENAELCKKVFLITDELKEEIEIANKHEEAMIMDDIEEETVSDEPIFSNESVEDKYNISPLYKRYLDIQKEYPDAVVAYRLGDFYEVFGKNAKLVSEKLDLTITGRDVGLPERVLMVGFPFHVSDKYIETILKDNAVVVVEPDEEPKYMMSYKELFTGEVKTDEELEEEQDENERAAELQSQQYVREQFDEDDEEYIDLDELEEIQEEKQPQEKSKSKPIKERKRKKPQQQFSLFDLMGESSEKEEKDLKEYLIERDLKRGSGFERGKMRICHEYAKNPTERDFADFLKNEYGLGGYGDGQYGASYDAKGMRLVMRDKDNYDEILAQADLKWNEVATRIADLIDDDNYLTAEEKIEFENYQAQRYGSDEDRIKAIVDWMVEQGTKYTWNGHYNNYKHGNNYTFVKEHITDIQNELENRNEIEKVGFAEMDGFNVWFKPEFCRHLIEREPQEENTETVTNTDLNEVGFDQSELGGAKARFKSNIEAIKTMKKLYREDRDSTPEERKVLARYVGWGGLANAFDEHNESWQREYAELKDLLTTEEYDAAKSSVLNAHYTAKEVIDGIYEALHRFGVRGNNKILEPALGTGNFFGFMPKEISDGAKLYGVELDSLTGKIATKLYPNTNIQIKGFEQTSFTNDSFDVVVSNVPFGAYSIYDSEYARHNFYVHDYFIAKSIDKLKPNGLMAVITSKGTMDKLNPTVRKYFADRAELLGAIRLPNNAFKQTANTEVVADILFFRKREEKINADNDNTEWLATGKTEEGFEINNYFINHPEMIMGTLVEERGLYGAMDVTVKPKDSDLPLDLSDAIGHLPSNFYINPEYSTNNDKEEIEVDYGIKPFCYKAVNGKLYIRIGDKMEEQEIPKHPKDAYERICKMIDLRQEIRGVLDMQISGCSDSELEIAQWQLNDKYDRFVKKYGNLNTQTNMRLFMPDGDSALLFACEEISEDKKVITKADVFSKRTIRPYVSAVQTDDCYEALQISMNERGKVDISYIEEITKKDYDTVLSELGNTVFRNPVEVIPEDKYSGFETAEKYLSGNVKKKLAVASAFSIQFPNDGYERNVQALQEVQPKPLTASEISVRVGASWVDKEYYKKFIMHMLDIPFYYNDAISLYFNPHDSSWRIDRATYIRNHSYLKVHEVYGTNRAHAYRLFEDCLNLRSTSIYDNIEEDGREKRVLNQAETIAAREKQNKMKEEFKDWIFEDPARREELEKTYNDLFNQIRLPTYDGSYLKFPEMNPLIELKPHQKNAVHRIISEGNTLLHHVVGSGKTFTICAAIMKLRQYGLAKKPMVAVPNHLVQQWANEFRTLYPNAKLLVASKEDLEKNNRKKFVSKVALGDWDAVIIAQSSFAKIPISPQRQERKLREEIARIEESIAAQWMENSHPRGAVKNLERIKKNREAQLKKLMDDTKKDDVLIFENLGVDYLFVDEAHYYKNLFLFTKMHNVAGISMSASQRASDLKLKCEYINELHGCDKGVVFATGTPISNSMTEMYTMQTYLGSETLKEIGINYFDGWAADFGETITSLEMAPSGQGYKAKTRFAKFTNLPELLTLYRSFADVQTSDMVKLEVPDVDREVITLKPSDTVIELAEEIADRAEDISQGGVPPEVDNMLKITSDGKKLALDARCYVPTSKDEETSKLNECASRVFEVWEESHDIKGTQIVFCDLSTPKKAFEDYEYGKDFDVYNDLKHKLIQKGIPENEIAFIHEANTDKQKQALFDSVNDGKVRVLIGSTEKCGAGTNVQKRLIALHHLDTPYRPSDMQQREGRIVRQGNTNERVKIFTYVTERTFDSYSYQILENKQRFISQIDKGDLTVREADDIDETTLSYAEIKAITAANPKIKRKMEVDAEVARLRVLEGQYKKNLYSMQDKIRKTFPEEIRRQEMYVERVKEDAKRAAENYNPEVFSINVNGVIYTDKKEGARALTEALYASKSDTVVAEFGGFKISMNPIVMLTSLRSVALTGTGQYNVDIGSSPSGNLTRIENFIEDFHRRQERAIDKLESLREELSVAQEVVKRPFEQAEQLAALLKEQTELNTELDLNRREEVIIDDEKDEGDTTFMALPYETENELKKTENSKKGKSRKPLKTNDWQFYQKIRNSESDTIVFIKNGDGYDAIGVEAKGLCEKFNKELLTDDFNGEEQEVFHIKEEELDNVIRTLVQDDGYRVKIVENTTQNLETKEDFIDVVDKVEEMNVAVLPDYSIDQDFVADKYGYSWKGMLPMWKRSAKRLYDLGLPVYRLNQDDTETKIEKSEMIDGDGIIYGIEKPDWVDFIESEKGKSYLATRYEMCKSASKFVTEELSYFDDGIIIDFVEDNFLEKEALKNYTLGFTPDKQYLNPMLDEFTHRIYNDMFTYYGWEQLDVARALADNLENEEFNKYANEEVRRWRLKDFVMGGIVEHNLLKELDDKSLGNIDDEDKAYEIVTELKVYFEGSEWAEGATGDEYDFWYDLFGEQELMPLLMGERYKDIDKEFDKVIDEMTVNETIDFLGINVDYKQKVMERVSDEFNQFRDKVLEKTPQEIFNYNYEIFVKNEISDTICFGENLDDVYYRAMYRYDGNILDAIFDKFRDSEYYSVNSYGDTTYLIQSFCKDELYEFYKKAKEEDSTEMLAVQKLLDACKLDDMSLSLDDDDVIVGIDEDNNVWKGKDLYELLLNDVVTVDQNYQVNDGYGVEQSIVSDVIRYAKQAKAEIHPVIQRPRYTIKDFDGEEVIVEPVLALYDVKDFADKEMVNVAIQLNSVEVRDGMEYKEPYATLTTSFGEFIGMKNSTYIDINNCPFATQLLNQGIAQDTGLTKQSGYVTYPLWQFDEEFLKSIGEEQYKQYSTKFDKYMRQFEEPEEEIDYKEAVREAINKEFEEFQEDLLKKEPFEVFQKNYEIHIKTELLDTINAYDFTDAQCKALYQEKDMGILQQLYDDFLGADGASVENGEEAVNFISEYCDYYHKEIMSDDSLNFVYYGKDKEDTGFYYFKDSLNIDNLHRIAEESDDYIIVAPVCYLPQESLEEKNITFLKLDRDVDEAELKLGSDTAKFAMRASYNKKLPLEATMVSRNCRLDIEDGISKNFDGSHLNSDFIDNLYALYGEERMNYVLANTVQTLNTDGRFSASNKEWASQFTINNSDGDRKQFFINSHPAVLDGVITSYRKKVQKFHEELDKEEQAMPENENQKKKWITAKVSHQAMIKEMPKHLFMKMPNNSEYDGYTYNVFKSKVKDSTQLVDMQSDSRETCFELLFAEDETIILRKQDDEVSLTAEEFRKIVNNTSDKDYERPENANSSERIQVSVPREALKGMYEKSSIFAFPKASDYYGYSFYLPNALLEEDKSTEEGRISMNLPSDFVITAKDRDGKKEIELTPNDIYDEMHDTDDFEYFREQTEVVEDKPKGKTDWKSIALPENLKIAQYEKSTLMRMPEGKYEGFVFYVPNGMVEVGEEENLILNLPHDFTLRLRDNQSGEESELSVEEFEKEINGKSGKKFQKPSETKIDKFADRKKLLDENIPQVMKDKPNWVIVRTKMNEEKGRLEKYLIDSHTGKFAKSDEPETWTDYETACKYASENGGVTLAFALDGKDGIACIDLDGCIDENGKRSELADEVLRKCGKTYIETSVSGKGLHIFGTTQGMDVRAFSRDGDMEFYQKSHFIAMTGDGTGFVNLESFDKPDMKSLIERKCDKRGEWKGAGAGIEGLSTMSDRDVVEKAYKAKHSETFKALYEGQDLQNNHSNSDMSLMNRLAFWCNGDKEQMLRIFATSGLFRPDKSPDYYETTAIKAIRDTTERYQPNMSNPTNTVKKPPVNNSGSGFGKR